MGRKINYVPFFLVGADIDPFFYTPFENLGVPELLFDADAESDKDYLASLVLSEFMDPYVAGNYAAIDPANVYDELMIDIAQYQDDPRMLVLMNAMSAAIGSRLLHDQLLNCNQRQAECETKRGDLQNQVAELERELKIARGQVDDMKQVETKIEAKVSIQSVEVLPMIAQVNIVMGWYYYMNGYDPLRPIDPLKYIDAKMLVVEYGYQLDEATGRYGAYDELMRRLIQDKADREVAASESEAPP